MDSLVDDLATGDALLAPPWGELGRSTTLGVVSAFSKFVLRVLNTFSIDGAEEFRRHVMERPEGVGLITVCNHTSTVDDPFLLSTIVPWGYFWTEHRHHSMRWSLCAREICYRNPLLGQFFASGKTLPVARGGGLDQPVMRAVSAEVAAGRWLHVFPEGKINFTGRLGPLRWGVGKIVCDAVGVSGRDPVVLPFYHSGMGRIMPKGGRIPRAGHQVSVVVGRPVELGDLTCRCHRKGEEQRAVWKDITARVSAALLALEAASPPNWDQVKGHEAEELARRSEGALPED